MRKDRFILLGIFAVSLGAAYIIGASYENFGILGQSFMAVLSVAILLWLFSFLSDNSSIFDPYWSIAPFFFLLFLFIRGNGPSLFKEGNLQNYHAIARLITVAVLVAVYGLRLTLNFFRGWKGLKPEDRNDVNLRNRSGMWYWSVSLLGIHIFPALLVFAGTLSLWVVVAESCRALNVLDILGLLVTGFAIWIEVTPRKLLGKWPDTDNFRDLAVTKRLGSVLRHPYYLSEICFWWGLYFFALAANPGYWWVILGPACITVMCFIAPPSGSAHPPFSFSALLSGSYNRSR